MSFKPISYLQTDARWKNVKYATSAESTTIGGSGCGPTAASMVIAEWVNPDETPLTACNWSMANGYKATGQGTYYSFFTPYFKKFGLKCEQLNGANVYHSPGAAAHLAAYNAVKQGDYVIACMGKGRWTSSGHFILWYGIDGDNVLINDPASTAQNRLKASWSFFKNEVKYYFAVRKPTNLKTTETTDYTVVDSDGYLNVRCGAGTSYDVFGTSKAGTVLPIEKVVGSWARFIQNGSRCYVNTAGLMRGVVPAAAVTTADKALEVLVEKGVINTADYWKAHMGELQYLDQLLINMANAKIGKAEKNGYTEVGQALEAMVKAKVINSPTYWAVNYSRLQYLDTLLIRFANMLE